MRRILKKHSTKAERRFAEVLKRLHIPFKHRWMVSGHEVDFLVGVYAIEVNGHTQDYKKNIVLVQSGYTPLHLSNNDTIEKWTSLLQKIDNDKLS